MRATRRTVLTATFAVPAGVAVAGVLPATAAAAACDLNPATPKRQFRAMWIASVANLDWPSRTGLGVDQLKAEFRGWLDLAEQYRMNAVVVQIRPAADAFWPSPHEPWSQWLTGTQGRNPGFDPLEFLVDEAHSRNIEFHAWFNPYRVANTTNLSHLASNHPVRQHPDWAFAYDGRTYYNPGIPAVREFVQTAMMHAVTNYDVDAVHFDDYFYPYPGGGSQIPDADTYAEFGGGIGNIEDWRRHNVDLLVQEMSAQIKAAKSHVAFGISPFGIWRNDSTDPLGSATSGLQSYDAIYADSRRWVTEGWLDYINPQLYWNIGLAAADYSVLVPWWANVADGTGTAVYAGQATYKIGSTSAWDAGEMRDHLTFNRQYPQVKGDVFFSAKDVRADPLGGMSATRSAHYAKPALPPVIGRVGSGTPGAPTIASVSGGAGSVTVSIAPGSGSPAYFAVYRVDGSGSSDPCAFEDATHLLGTARSTGSSTGFVDRTAQSGQQYTYYATALSRNHRESGRSAGQAHTPGDGGGWSATIDNADSGFAASAAWGTSSFSGQRHGADYRFADPVSSSDVAWFSASIPATGSYRVEVWYPADPGYNSATPYVVATTGGNQSVSVDQRSGGGRWVSLGTFPLAGGSHRVVGVSRWTSGSGYVIADAVRLTQV